MITNQQSGQYLTSNAEYAGFGAFIMWSNLGGTGVSPMVGGTQAKTGSIGVVKELGDVSAMNTSMVGG